MHHCIIVTVIIIIIIIIIIIMNSSYTTLCVRFFQNVASSCRVTMSSRVRSSSLDRHSDDRPSTEHHGGRGFASAGLGDGGGQSGSHWIRTSSSAVDGWTSDNDVTNSAWRSTVRSSSSSANNGEFYSLRVSYFLVFLPRCV